MNVKKLVKVHPTISERYRANLKRLREKQGLSQPLLAALMGINAEYLGQLERGHRSPSLAMIERTALILDVDQSELLKEV